MTGTNLSTPLYPHYQQQFGFGSLTVTLVFAAYVATLVPALLFLGPLSDAIGTRRVVLASIAMAILASLAAAFATSVIWLLVARVGQGIALGAASGALSAALVQNEPRGDRARASLAGAVAPNLGTGLGPLLAGVLAQYAPAPTLLPYLVEVALLVVAAIVMPLVVDETPRARWRPHRPSVPAEIRGAFAGSALTAMVAFAVVGLFLALLPSLAHTKNLAVVGLTIGLLFAACIAAQGASFHATAVTRETVGLPVLAAGLALLVLSGALGGQVWLLAATAVAGVGLGLAFSGSLARLNQVAPPERGAEIVSSFYVAVYLGLGVPVVGVALLALAIGLVPAVDVFSVVAAASCVVRLVTVIVGRRRTTS